MVSVNMGILECSRCGCECTNLYGLTFTVPEQRIYNNPKVFAAVKKLDEDYGRHNFVFCLPCCLEAMGVGKLKKDNKEPEQVQVDNSVEKKNIRIGTKNESK